MDFKDVKEKVEDAWPHDVSLELLSVEHKHPDYEILLKTVRGRKKPGTYGTGRLQVLELKNEKTNEIFIGRLDGGDIKDGRREDVRLDIDHPDIWSEPEKLKFKEMRGGYSGHHSESFKTIEGKQGFKLDIKANGMDIFKGSVVFTSLSMDKLIRTKVTMKDHPVCTVRNEKGEIVQVN